MRMNIPSKSDIFREKRTERINSYYYAITKDKETKNTYRGKTLAEIKYLFTVIHNEEKHTGIKFICLYIDKVDEFIRLLHEEEKLWLDNVIDQNLNYEIEEQFCIHPLPV